jgi:hypothetical protein
MHHYVQAAEAVIDGIEQSGRRILIGKVSRESCPAPPPGLDLPDRPVGQVHIADIGHHDVKPVGSQPGGDGLAHAAGPPGHQSRPRAADRGIACRHDSSHLTFVPYTSSLKAQCCHLIRAAHRQVM